MTVNPNDLVNVDVPGGFKFTDKQIEKLFLRLRQTKEELLYDVERGKCGYYKLEQRGGKILGVAHCDFVESAWSYPTWVRNAGNGKQVIRAGQVDDRVGVWLLLDVLSEIDGMPQFDYLLTTDEEIGQSTAQDVKEELKYNWTFQFDRRGTDFVDYGKASNEFVAAFKEWTGIPYGQGSFSDICWLPVGCGSRVNVGTGYHDEHHVDAYVDLKECADQVERFVRFAKGFSESEFPLPKGVGVRESSRRSYGSYGGAWSHSRDDDDDYTWPKATKGVSKETSTEAKRIAAALNGDDDGYIDPEDVDVDDIFELESRLDAGEQLSEAELDLLAHHGIIDYADIDDILYSWGK